MIECRRCQELQEENRVLRALLEDQIEAARAYQLTRPIPAVVEVSPSSTIPALQALGK